MTPILQPTDLSQFALPAPVSNKGKQALDQGDFLMLMTTQLQNQDPLKPLDNNEFIAQMAQFSTVDGISNMNRSMQGLAESFSANQALQAATMVGRTVLTEGDNGRYAPGGQLAGAVEVPFASASVNVRIYSETGALVKQLSLGARDSGLADFGWDGQQSDGTQAPAGRYYVSASVSGGGTDTPLTSYIASRVNSVTLNGSSGAQLSTDGGLEIRLSQVKAIR